MTDGGLRRASQTFATERLALCLIETSRSDIRQRQPEVRQRGDPGIGLESLAGEANRLMSPGLRVFGPPPLGIDQGEQPEAPDVALGDAGCIGAFGGLERQAPRLIEITGEIQRLRQGCEDADDQDVRARLVGGRDRTTSVINRGTDVTAGKPVGTGELSDRLRVRRPQLRALTACALRHREKPLDLDLRCRQQRRGHRSPGGQRGALDEQLRWKPPYPAKELPGPPAPDELAVVLDEQLGHQFGVPTGGGILDRVLDVPMGTAPSDRAASNGVSFLGPQL